MSRSEAKHRLFFSALRLCAHNAHEKIMVVVSQRACLALSVALHVIGVLAFLKGFFLTRNELAHVSKCAPDEGVRSSNGPGLLESRWGGPGCTPGVPRRFRRAIVVVIDALRFDFLASQRVAPSNDGSGDERFCESTCLVAPRSPSLNFVLRAIPGLPLNYGITDRGHLHSLHTAAENDPEHALLLRCRADPPTVTLQRLKGMTTGGMPTFIDFKDNFGGPQSGPRRRTGADGRASSRDEVDEDNLISQLVSSGRRVVFMGDDTWARLYPGKFERAYPFPSFNVRDLHTVDDGVER